jgi:hypothetical protein
MKIFSLKTFFSVGHLKGSMFALAGVLVVIPVRAQTSLSFDFEQSAFTEGSIMGQQGWSAGASGDTLLTDPSDSVTITDETITSAAAASGTQSWLYSHGITSGYQYGPGTPFTPNLGVSLSTVGYQFTGSLQFKAATMGDGSRIQLATGNPEGDDRAELIGYIDNYAGGTNLTVTLLALNEARNDYVEIIVAQDLDDGWHQIDFTISRTGVSFNLVSLMVDGSMLMMQTAEGVMGAYREEENYDYAESSRLKFAGSKTGEGFYFDDITYSITAVPEPSTYAAVLGGLVLACAALRRSRKQADATSA